MSLHACGYVCRTGHNALAMFICEGGSATGSIRAVPQLWCVWSRIVNPMLVVLLQAWHGSNSNNHKNSDSSVPKKQASEESKYLKAAYGTRFRANRSKSTVPLHPANSGKQLKFSSGGFQIPSGRELD
jgi:hypothetical protein